jgi:CheY-like chemotaxis protein
VVFLEELGLPLHRRIPVARIVLVADDSPTIQKKAVGILKGEGFDVETVSNGVAAIKRLGTIMPSVILADVSMPGRDGYEVCEYVKKSVQLSHVPVLLIASEMEPYDQARGAEVRADGIIKKPFEPQELISTVEKYAAKAEAALKPEDTEPLLGTPLPITPEPVAEFEFSNEVPEERPRRSRRTPIHRSR